MNYIDGLLAHQLRFYEIGLGLFELVWVLFICFGLGRMILSFFRVREMSTLFRVGASLLIGWGLLAYLILLLGIAGMVNKTGILLLLAVLTIAVASAVCRSVSQVVPKLRAKIISSSIRPLDVIVLAIIAIIVCSHLLATFAPPFFNDEIAYHFPEANLILGQGKASFPLGGHYFYGNIPILGEVLYAGAISVGGYSLAHLFHYGIFLSFLVLVAGFVSHYYNRRSGLLAVLFLLLIPDLTDNAITGYVDAATLSFELSALLLVGDWLIKKRNSSLWISAVLLGFALSFKYAPLFSALFIVVTIIVAGFARKKGGLAILRMVSVYILLVALCGGFWYIKNLVMFGNPFYPLYLGHKGVDESTYLGLINAIQSFVVPRTVANFFSIPIKFYLSANYLTVLPAFFVAPWLAIKVKNRSLNFLLVSFFLCFSLYWFFVATHQTRFLLPALVAAAVAMSVVLVDLRKWVIGPILVYALILAFARNDGKPIITNSKMREYVVNTFKINQAYAGLGGETKAEFLGRYFGCGIEVVGYLEDNQMQGNVIDNWSVWHDPNLSFYATKNRFYIAPVSGTKEQLIKDIKQDEVRFIYYNEATRARFFANPDPAVQGFRLNREEQEEWLIERSKLIYSENSCRLYQIELPQS